MRKNLTISERQKLVGNEFRIQPARKTARMTLLQFALSKSEIVYYAKLGEPIDWRKNEAQTIWPLSVTFAQFVILLTEIYKSIEMFSESIT